MDRMLTLSELDYLEEGLHEAIFRGIPIKAVILCNPHNPLARCYPYAVIAAYSQFCERHGIHLLADEIFALSVFSQHNSAVPPESFHSVLELDTTVLGVDPARLHVLYGMSKDFLSNGLRAAVLVSQANTAVLHSLLSVSPFMSVASPTASLWATLLTDISSYSAFLAESRRRLYHAYDRMTAWLTFHGIQYAPACAGQFLLVDFRPVLIDLTRYGATLAVHAEQTMAERERALTTHLLLHGVAVMPGAACHLAEEGWYRMTFSLREEQMDVAFGRIENALGWDHWQTWDRVIHPKL